MIKIEKKHYGKTITFTESSFQSKYSAAVWTEGEQEKSASLKASVRLTGEAGWCDLWASYCEKSWRGDFQHISWTMGTAGAHASSRGKCVACPQVKMDLAISNIQRVTGLKEAPEGK